MINCCVNPSCGIECKLLDRGDLYAIERPNTEKEFFWLCSECAARLRPSLDSTGAFVLQPRTQSDQPASSPHFAAGSLYLVAHAARRLPSQESVPADSLRKSQSSADWVGGTRGAHQ